MLLLLLAACTRNSQSQGDQFNNVYAAVAWPGPARPGYDDDNHRLTTTTNDDDDDDDIRSLIGL